MRTTFIHTAARNIIAPVLSISMLMPSFSYGQGQYEHLGMYGLKGVSGIAITNKQSNNIRYEYDKLGRVKKITYEDNSVVEYKYDRNGNIESVKKTDNKGNDNTGTGGNGNTGTPEGVPGGIGGIPVSPDTDPEVTSGGSTNGDNTNGTNGKNASSGNTSSYAAISEQEIRNQRITMKTIKGEVIKTYGIMKPFRIQGKDIRTYSPNANVMTVSEIKAKIKKITIHATMEDTIEKPNKNSYLVCSIGEGGRLKSIEISSYDKKTKILAFQANKNGRYIVVVKPKYYQNDIGKFYEMSVARAIQGSMKTVQKKLANIKFTPSQEVKAYLQQDTILSVKIGKIIWNIWQGAIQKK